MSTEGESTPDQVRKFRIGTEFECTFVKVEDDLKKDRIIVEEKECGENKTIAATTYQLSSVKFGRILLTSVFFTGLFWSLQASGFLYKLVEVTKLFLQG